jgi:Transposase DDE domain group 1
VKSIGLYPRVHVDTKGTPVVSQAGGVALVETVRAAGLDRSLSRSLAPWRKPMAIHGPGKVIADLAVAVALGGDCLADVALLRAEPAVFGAVASDPTVSRTIDALAADAPAALKAIDTARRACSWSRHRCQPAPPERPRANSPTAQSPTNERIPRPYDQQPRRERSGLIRAY